MLSTQKSITTQTIFPKHKKRKKKDFVHTQRGFPSASVSKESACNVEDLDLKHGSGRSLVVGNGHPLQYSCPGNPMGRGAWWAIVHGSQESDVTQRLNHHQQPTTRAKSEDIHHQQNHTSRITKGGSLGHRKSYPRWKCGF